MKILKFSDYINERFNAKTISRNNDVYLSYYNKYHDKDRRAGIVAWVADDSQVANWDLINKHIKNGDSVLDYGCGIGDVIDYFNKKRKKISSYTGIDINPEFIELAKKTYPDANFQLIKNVDEIKGSYDVVFASGVFTWFITKKDFIKALTNLYNAANREVLLTFLYDVDENYHRFWTQNYRKYNEVIFEKLFPQWNMEFEIDPFEDYLLVRIIK